ncbi:MAG TPA: IPT/TIG domain-containing protein [Acidimicrobiales bacterium]|nr:IPT/TIG domain-containing protein [Acidimicrobiales bacterium]
MLAISAALGSFAFLGGAASAATDSGTGSAFGIQAVLAGTNLIPPTPSVALGTNGQAASNTLLPVNIPGVLVAGVASASSSSTNFGTAAETITSSASLASATALSLLTIGAVQSTCTSNAKGSTGGTTVASISAAGAPIPIPSSGPVSLPAPLNALLSITINGQVVANAPGSTSITVDALKITVLATAVEVTVAESKCAATGPDINAVATPPTVTSVTPNTGPAAGGTTVTITGSGFTCVTGVKFGTTPAATFTVVNATTITATSPPGTPGTVDVTVTSCNGTSPTNTGDQFTFTAAGGGSGTVPGGSGASPGTSTGTGTGTGAISGVTAVHTGEPWAGSIPLAIIVFLLGCALFWRRGLTSAVSRTTHAMATLRRGDDQR